MYIIVVRTKMLHKDIYRGNFRVVAPAAVAPSQRVSIFYLLVDKITNSAFYGNLMGKLILKHRKLIIFVITRAYKDNFCPSQAWDKNCLYMHSL